MEQDSQAALLVTTALEEAQLWWCCHDTEMAHLRGYNYLMTIGIYKITCQTTGQCYIGQSKHIEDRWRDHHKRFSPDAYDYEILRIVNIPQFMNAFEKHYIKLYDSHVNGFNLTLGGTGFKCRYRAPVSELTRERLAKSATGKTPSAEARLKISKAQVGRIGPNNGKKFSDEWIANLRKGSQRRYAKIREEQV